jgi:hypothetical protein
MFKEHGKEDLEVKISNQFATLENMSRWLQDINKTWKNVRDNSKIQSKSSLHTYEWKLQKTCFDKEYSELLDQKDQVKAQWSQDPNHINVGTFWK